MRTKYGKALVKENSKRMEKIFDEMKAVAKKMEKTTPKDERDAGRYSHDYRDSLLDQARQLKEERDSLQAEINDMCYIEAVTKES